MTSGRTKCCVLLLDWGFYGRYDNWSCGSGLKYKHTGDGCPSMLAGGCAEACGV
ncbi:MAG: hypothetical protein ACKESB_02990 [Candidatus Hodgkinia cicadicola]